ncbi:MAG: hypothetical protein AAB347_03935 [Bacteroidota bacterium]
MFYDKIPKIPIISFSDICTISSSEISEFRQKRSKCNIQYFAADGSSFVIPNPGCRSFVALPRAAIL